MIYFFHHYELPAILQQARIQQIIIESQNQPTASGSGSNGSDGTDGRGGSDGPSGNGDNNQNNGANPQEGIYSLLVLDSFFYKILSLVDLKLLKAMIHRLKKNLT